MTPEEFYQTVCSKQWNEVKEQIRPIAELKAKVNVIFTLVTLILVFVLGIASFAIQGMFRVKYAEKAVYTDAVERVADFYPAQPREPGKLRYDPRD